MGIQDIFQEIKNTALENPISKGLEKQIKEKIRERAINDAMAKIVINDKKREDFSEEEFEILVQEAEAKLHDTIKSLSFAGVLAFLGISTF